MKIEDQLFTLRDYMRYVCQRLHNSDVFYGHGTDNAWDEAVQLVFAAAGLPGDTSPAVLDARLLLEEKQRIAVWLERRIEDKVPLPYITGEAWFCGLPFYVDERVLIPRSPIAEMIEQQFTSWLEVGQAQRVLDLCTGSACIAIALAYAFPDAEVVATELSEDALQVAEQNSLRHGVEARLQLRQGDLFADIDPETEGGFDLIVSNPPYVDGDDFAYMPNEFQHEPEMALVSGEDGLDITRRILAEAKRFLNPGGVLVVEVGNSWPALEAAYPELVFEWPEFSRGGGGVFVLRREDLPG